MEILSYIFLVIFVVVLLKLIIFLYKRWQWLHTPEGKAVMAKIDEEGDTNIFIELRDLKKRAEEAEHQEKLKDLAVEKRRKEEIDAILKPPPPPAPHKKTPDEELQELLAKSKLRK